MEKTHSGIFNWVWFSCSMFKAHFVWVLHLGSSILFKVSFFSLPFCLTSHLIFPSWFLIIYRKDITQSHKCTFPCRHLRLSMIFFSTFLASKLLLLIIYICRVSDVCKYFSIHVLVYTGSLILIMGTTWNMESHSDMEQTMKYSKGIYHFNHSKPLILSSSFQHRQPPILAP